MVYTLIRSVVTAKKFLARVTVIKIILNRVAILISRRTANLYDITECTVIFLGIAISTQVIASDYGDHKDRRNTDCNKGFDTFFRGHNPPTIR